MEEYKDKWMLTEAQSASSGRRGTWRLGKGVGELVGTRTRRLSVAI